MSIAYTQEEFESEANKIYGDLYDYSYDNYIRMDMPYKILCKKHGFFVKKPRDIIHQKQGCIECVLDNIEETKRSKRINAVENKHQGKYTIYSFGEYVKSNSWRVTGCCREHGLYETTVHKITKRADGGCPKCKSLSEGFKFIEKAKNIHGNKYDYKAEDYIDSREEMEIFCKNHKKVFRQRPSAHISGQGCPECGLESTIKNIMFSREDFIEKAISQYGDVYNYTDSMYNGMNSPITIRCPKHGNFTKNNANNFINGDGCPVCAKDFIRRGHAAKFFDYFNNNENYSNLDFSKAIYVNNRTYIDIYCSDHEEWFKSTPNKISNGEGSVGCKQCLKLKLSRWTIKSLKKIPNVDKTTGYFYYGKVQGVDGFKIGITKNLAQRLSVYRRDLQKSNSYFNYIGYIKTTTIKSSFIESLIKAAYKDYNVKTDLDFGGKSEIYNIDKTDLLLDIIDGRFDCEIEYLIKTCDSSTDKVFKDFVVKLKTLYDIK
jgi:hypothetical protein